MPQAKANGITLEYQTFGDPSGTPLLLICGLGSQMITWKPELIERLIGKGLYLIAFDNRDVGLSEKIGDSRPNIPELMETVLSGGKPDVPYTLFDMAADAAGLLAALKIPAAHILGVSMGGMIAQVFAGTYPEKTLSLTSIMSSSGAPGLKQATEAAMKTLSERPKSKERADIVANGLRSSKIIGSAPQYIDTDERLTARAADSFDRCYYPLGYLRQHAGIIGTGDRTDLLKGIKAPTLVIHGDIDPLVPVEHGIDTANKIPGARLEIIEGMGHDLPVKLTDRIASLIVDHTLVGEVV